MWDGRELLKVEQAMALRNNREIRAQFEQIAASRADLAQVGLLPNLVVGLTLRFPFDPVSGGSFIGAQVAQPFSAVWLREGKVKAADTGLNQSVLDISDKALGLVTEAKATQPRIAFGQSALALGDENLATIQKSIESLDDPVRGGEGTPLNVNRAKQQQAKAQAERAVVLRDLAKKRRRMLELVGFASEGAE